AISLPLGSPFLPYRVQPRIGKCQTLVNPRSFGAMDLMGFDDNLSPDTAPAEATKNPFGLSWAVPSSAPSRSLRPLSIPGPWFDRQRMEEAWRKHGGSTVELRMRIGISSSVDGETPRADTKPSSFVACVNNTVLVIVSSSLRYLR